ncbi:vomeronasal type-2 receptor 26-like [Discoglossus pictus]
MSIHYYWKLLHCAFIIDVLLFPADEAICTNRNPADKMLSSDQLPRSYSRDGDIIIGGILHIYLLAVGDEPDFLDVPYPVTCVGPSLWYLRHLLAFIYAIEEINDSIDILPNITLGFHIYDACTSEVMALISTLSTISGKEQPIPNFICQGGQRTVALIGHKSSSPSYTMAEITRTYGYPQISYGAMDPVFNDRVRFPYIYRTVPVEHSQIKVIIQLLIHFGWTWVGIIASNDDSNQWASQELKKEMEKSGICVEFLAIISNKPENIGASVRKLNNYLKKVHVKIASGEDLFFTEEGYIPGGFDIQNCVTYTNGTIKKIHIGSFLPSSDQQLPINESNIMWGPHFNQTPSSVCTEICPPGFRQAPQIGKPPCCFDCIPCSEGEISNSTCMGNCVKCPEDSWSNLKRDKCIKRTIDFLSYDDHIGAIMTAVVCISSLVTGAVLSVFIKHKHTPIVRANNLILSYILLVSLLLSFLSSFLFIGHPWEITCMLRQVAFRLIFTVAISSVLGKTVTVVIAFNATKPGSRLRKWMGSKMSFGLLFACSTGEIMICVTWLICSPPFLDYDTKSTPGKIILQCNEGSLIAFYLSLSYIGVLALVSFIVAFIARKLPDTFNEAKYITFSMIVVCSVWISFIPTYLSTNGKYMVAVEVFTILSSAIGLLICIFFPKCYIILIKPEFNSKSHLSFNKVYEGCIVASPRNHHLLWPLSDLCSLCQQELVQERDRGRKNDGAARGIQRRPDGNDKGDSSAKCAAKAG